MEKEKSTKKENKGLKIFLIILIILTFLLAGGGYLYCKQKADKIEEQNQKALKTISETVEYGKDISYEDILPKLITATELTEGTTYTIKIDGKTLNPTEKYKAEKVGDLLITVETHSSTLLFDNINNIQKNTWKVEDTQKPIIEGVSNKEITQGDTFDAKAGITAKDEVDGDLEVIIEGNVDTTKEGTYTLTVKAVDKNGNETKQEFTVTVKKKEEKVTTSPKQTVASGKKTTTNTKTTNSTTNKASTSNTNKSTTTTKTNTSTTKKSDPTSTKAGRLKLAKAEAKKVASKIITSGMTKKQKAIAICQYITNTVTAQNDQSTEAYKKNYGDEAYAALILKKAACSGRCHAVTLLCNVAGLESKHINENKWTHQWNKVKIDDGSWLVIDPQIGYYGERHPLE